MIRMLLAWISSGVVTNLAARLTFLPAQRVLADPELQSPKFLSAFFEEPYPRAAEVPYLFELGIALFALCQVLAWRLLISREQRGLLSLGLRFGVASWLLGFLWFEYYLPWNVMREPTGLVLLELGCWLVVSMLGSFTIAGVMLGRSARA